MAKDRSFELLEMTRPNRFLGGMALFVTLMALMAAALFDRIETAFLSNPFLNGLILGVLLIGIVLCFLQVLRLTPSVHWIERYRFDDQSLSGPSDTAPPDLMAPMAALLRDSYGSTSLSAAALQSILDSIGSRLDESREISRYLIGLLVFLGLLGTFWGLLQTITSVGDSIRALSFNEGAAEQVFGDLIAGLEAPLAGMGLAFSSSLFGLAGSLVLGFLDLRAGQAQNRFYNELEEHLSTRTQLFSPDSNGQPEQSYDDAGVEILAHEIRALRESLGTSDPVDTHMLNTIHDLQESLRTAIEHLTLHGGGGAGGGRELKEAAADLKVAIHKMQIDGPSEQQETLNDIRNDIRILSRTLISIFEKASGED